MNLEEPRGDADVEPSLDSLDDAALRAIAYGRATDDRERMRAHTASRILANRYAAVMPRPRDAHDAIGGGLASAASQQVGTGVSESSPDDDSDESDDSRLPTPRHRVVLIGAVSAALLAGGVVGVTAGQMIEALQPDSLAVFDRPATDEETAALAANFSVRSGEARLLAETDHARVYGVRTDAGVFLGTGELGTEVCLIADNTREVAHFYPLTCIPEQVFREHGMSGVLPALDLSSTDITPPVVSAYAFQWGPRGDLQLEDISADILTTTTDRFSEQDLQQGLDIPLVRVIRDQEPDPAIARKLPGALFGPVDIGTVSAGAGVTARLWGSIFPDPDGSEGSAVCLSAEVQGDLVAHECEPMATFRTEGGDAMFLRGDAVVSASVDPSGAVSTVIEE